MNHLRSVAGHEEEDEDFDKDLVEETEEMRDFGTWSWATWLCAAVLVLCCGGCVCGCMVWCTCLSTLGLAAEMGSFCNLSGYVLLDLGSEEDIPRILRREMQMA